MGESVQASLGLLDHLRGMITTTGKSGIKPPDNIIKTVAAARSVYFKQRNVNIKRVKALALIEGQLAGNPPYDPAELIKLGLGHIANFNPLDARAQYEKLAQSYWNLLNETENICKFSVNIQHPNRVRFQDILDNEWTKIVKQHPSFETNTNILTANLVKFGLSCAFFPDERDWSWRALDVAKVFIPDQAQADLDQLTCISIESMFSAQFLFETYEYYKDKPKENCPWDIDELSHLLLHIANTFAKTSYEFIDFVDLQRRLQNGDIGYDVLFTDAIRLVTLFYKEYTGEWSVHMFHRTYDNGKLLYFADRQYKNLDEMMILFTGCPGEFTLHSNKGLGHKIFQTMSALAQLDCSIVDNARWASTPLLRGQAQGFKDKQQIRFMPGVVTDIGVSEFVQNTMGANLQQSIGVAQYLLNKVQFNAANSGDDPSMPDRDKGSISPSEFRGRSFKEFSVLKNNVAQFYKSFDKVIQTMVVRMLNSKKGYPGYEYVKEWKDSCIDQGVPEEIFSMGKLTPWGMPRQLGVKAARVAGDGSTLARLMGLAELQPIVGSFGAEDAKEYKRQLISAALGKDQVTAFMQDQTPGISDASSVAGVENAVMQLGQSPVFAPSNDHVAHFGVHSALAMQTIQAVQEQKTTPVDADKVFSVLVPHLQEHFMTAAKSIFDQEFVANAKKNLDQIVQYATLNRKNAEKMLIAQQKEQQQLAQQQQQVMSEEQLKTIKMQGDSARADFKVRAQVDRAKEANATRAEIMREKVFKDAENQRLKIKLEANSKQSVDTGGTAVNTGSIAADNVSQARTDLAQMRDEGGPAPGDLPSPQVIPPTVRGSLFE